MADLTHPILMHGYPRGVADPRISAILIPAWDPDELREYVVQFTHSLLAHERRAMQVWHGLTLAEYVPKYTYLETIDEETAAALAGHPLVNAAFPMTAVQFAAPGVAESPRAFGLPEPAEAAALPPIPLEDMAPAAAADRLLWVSLSPRANPGAVARELERLGGRETRVFDDRVIGGGSYVQVAMPAAAVYAIMGVHGVRWIEDVPHASADSVALPALLEVGIAGVPAPYLDNGLRGKDQIVSIIDSGSLDTTHCWFRDQSDATAPGPFHRKVVGMRDANKGVSEHATFVAGILAGDDIAQPGAPLRGLACDARITFGNRLDTNGTSAWASLYKYLVLAAQDLAHVHNASWHNSRTEPHHAEYSKHAIDVDRFVWEHEECLVVGASGNNQEQKFGLGPPGSAKNALCVSAAFVDPESGRACLADGIHGPTQDGRRKPDLLAPGCGIESAAPANAAAGDCPRGPYTGNDEPHPGHAPGGDGSRLCAASFATPVVSAAAVLVRQYFVEGFYPTGEKCPKHERTPTAALLKATLLNATARAGARYRYPTDAEGWGLLRLNRILRLPDASRQIRVWDVRNAVGMFTAESRTHRVVVNKAGRPLKVTLVWTEPPGLDVAEDPVVNDLDLVVTAPDGVTTYLGNWFRYGASSAGAPRKPAQPDTRNNVEMVLVRKAAKGIWTIEVNATEVNVGNTGQGYALVVRGELD